MIVLTIHRLALTWLAGLGYGVTGILEPGSGIGVNMLCDMQPYGRYDARGRQRFRCSRKRCDKYAGWIRSDKRRVHSSCRAGLYLGDHLAWFFAHVGIKKKGCGCGRRQEALNCWSYLCTNAVAQTWRIVVGIPHDLIATLLLKLATLLTRTKL